MSRVSVSVGGVVATPRLTADSDFNPEASTQAHERIRARLPSSTPQQAPSLPLQAELRDASQPDSWPRTSRWRRATCMCRRQWVRSCRELRGPSQRRCQVVLHSVNRRDRAMLLVKVQTDGTCLPAAVSATAPPAHGAPGRRPDRHSRGGKRGACGPTWRSPDGAGTFLAGATG